MMLFRRRDRFRNSALLCLLLFLAILTYGWFIPEKRGPSVEASNRLEDIANSTIGFQNIFVVSLPTRTDRRDALTLAASISGLKLDWVDGVSGEQILEKAFPSGNHSTMPPGNKGSWRAHMNALRTVVERNLTTALILEDDADWDFRIKNQLQTFALAVSHMPNLLSQPMSVRGKPGQSTGAKLSKIDAAKRSALTLPSLTSHLRSKDHPFGSGWDILWLGHCGAHLPPPSSRPDRILIPDDETVPAPHHLRSMPRAPRDEISMLYSPHTRVVHRSQDTLCTIAYAVSQAGARKLLYEFGVREFSKGFDFALSDFCDGKARQGDARDERWRPMCITMQPPLFSHHFGEKAGDSDITGLGAGGAQGFGTRYVRWSVRMNMERVLKGQEARDQWPDDDKVES